MPILRHDDMLEAGDQTIDDGNNVACSRDCQRAGDKIVLHVDDDKDVGFGSLDTTVHDSVSGGAVPAIQHRTRRCLSMPWNFGSDVLQISSANRHRG